jgi:hypothetical protein
VTIFRKEPEQSEIRAAVSSGERLFPNTWHIEVTLQVTFMTLPRVPLPDQLQQTRCSSCDFTEMKAMSDVERRTSEVASLEPVVTEFAAAQHLSPCDLGAGQEQRRVHALVDLVGATEVCLGLVVPFEHRGQAAQRDVEDFEYRDIAARQNVGMGRQARGQERRGIL